MRFPTCWLLISAAGTLQAAPQTKTWSLTHLKSFLGSSDPCPRLLSQRSGLGNEAMFVAGAFLGTDHQYQLFSFSFS